MSMISHGGNLTAMMEAYGGNTSDWLDLSTGIAPFSVELPQISDDVWRRLPDDTLKHGVEQKAAQYYGSDIEAIACAGSQQCIQILPHILTSNDDDHKIGILGPTYGEYAAAFQHFGHEYVMLDNLDNLDHVKSVILANPNNPDGRLFTKDILLGVADKLAARGGYLVVDEAFADMLPDVSLCSDVQKHGAIIVMRSIGKFFGLAGLRLGFVFCPQNLQDKVRQYIGPWPVSGPALSIGQHLFDDHTITKRQREKIHHRHFEMSEQLSQTEFEIVGQIPLFFLIQHDHAEMLYKFLLKHRILTRKFDYAPCWLRIGLTQNHDEDQRLIDALKQFKEH